MAHMQRLIAACAGCVLVLFSGAVPAQGYPAKPIRVVVPYAPGGATDLVARLMAPKYTGLLRQQFIVDNRPGANGVIGSDLAAKAAPDGYAIHLATTLLWREHSGGDIVMATHDVALATAARACGLTVVGAS